LLILILHIEKVGRISEAELVNENETPP